MSQQNSSRAYLIFFIGCFLYVYGYILRIFPSTMTHELMLHFGVQAGGFGLMSAMFFYGYTPMQIPAGLLYDYLGTRILMSLAIFLCAAATLIFGLTQVVYVAGLCRLLMGMSASFGFIGALLLASRWLSREHYPFWAGFVQLLGALGAIVGLTPVALLTHHYGWELTIYGTSAIGFMFVLLTLLIIRNQPQDLALSLQPHHTHIKEDLKILFKNPQTWWIGVVAFGSWAPISTFASLWGVPFMMATYHQAATQAGSEISLIWIGVAIGSPLIGWLSNKIRSRKMPLMVSAIIATIASIGVLYMHGLPLMWMNVLLFLFGIGASSQMTTFALVHDINSPRVMGTANGLNNMFVMLGGLLIQPLVGFILNAVWDHKGFIDGVPAYTGHDFQQALFVIPLISILTIVVSLFCIKETLKQ